VEKRSDQKWILNEFFKVYDVYSHRNMQFVEGGFKWANVKRTSERIKHSRMIVKEWVRTARQEEEMAKRAESDGKLQTAAEFYHQAALYYGPAVGGIHRNSEQKKEIYAHLVDCYEKFIKYSGLSIERVEIPFENGKTIPGIFQYDPAKTKAPCIICVPGMDTIKEYFPSPYNNPFLRRGMASLTIDGPGQGESNIRETWVTLNNYERAGKATVDYLCSRPEIDKEKIGLYGWSMGSYWGPRVAAYESRIKAVVGAMGCYTDKNVIFNQYRPGYKANYMYMSNISDEDEFDRMAEKMNLETVVDRIKCPILLAQGELDDLEPLENAYRFFDMLKCPKEIWVFENEIHGLGGRLCDFYPMAADWLKDMIEGKYPKDLAKKVFLDAR
jgi:dipeptidyl aminopeptidase/acylaminoacyl peptidase